MKYKDNVRKQLIKCMLYNYLHSSNNKKTESLDSWETPMVCGILPLSVVSAVALFKVTTSESLV